MDAEALSALVFAVVVIVSGWRYFDRGLAAENFSRSWRRLILGIGAAVILLCCLYYLNLI